MPDKTDTAGHVALSKKIARLLGKTLFHREQGGLHFDQAGKALEKVLAAGVPIGKPIAISRGRVVVVKDQFAEKNTAYAAKQFQRFKVEPWKEPKPGPSRTGGKKKTAKDAKGAKGAKRK